MDTNFEKIVISLRALKFTDAQLARLCGCTRQHIGNIGNGYVKDVGFSIGRKLEKLHEAVV